MKKQKLWLLSSLATLTVAAAVLLAVACWLTPLVSAGTRMYDGVGGTFTGTGPTGQKATFNSPESALNGWGAIDGYVVDQDNDENLFVGKIRFYVSQVIVGGNAYSKIRQYYSDVPAPGTGEHGVLMYFVLENKGDNAISPWYMNMCMGGCAGYWAYTKYTAYVSPGKSMTFLFYAVIPDDAEMIPWLGLVLNDGSGVNANQYVYMNFPIESSGPNPTNPSDNPVAPTIVKQPKDKGAIVGSTAEFSVEAYGNSALTYQWQYRKNASSSWANSGQKGAKTDTLQVGVTESLNGYQFRCIITDPSNGMQSITKTVTLSVNVHIMAESGNRNAASGSTAKFSVAATGVGPLSYQWQQRQNSSSSWVNSTLTGANTDTLSVPATSGRNGYQFQCLVSDAMGNMTASSTATLTVVPITFSSEPADKSVNAGSIATFSVSASGTGTLAYQWQSRKNVTSTWTNSGQSGAKSATLSVSTNAGLDGWQFRCIVTDGNGRQAETNPAQLTINAQITKQPANTSVLTGSNATFTVEAVGSGTLSYKWQSRKNSSASWVNSGQNGARTKTLTVATNAGLNGYQFRCIVTDSKGKTATSNVVTLTVGAVAITSQPANTSVSAGERAVFSVQAIGSGTLIYQWQSRKNSSADWVNSGQNGAKTSTLTVTTNAGLNGYQFRCVVKDSKGNRVVSNTAILSIVPKITTQPKNATVKVGAKATYTIAATGTGTLKYQWQSRKNSSATWVNSGQSGAKTSTLTVTSNAGLNNYQFRCIVTDANGQTSVSNTVLLKIQ